jgi:hypothetical protein
MLSPWQANVDSANRQYEAFIQWREREDFYDFIEAHRTGYRILFERDDDGVSVVHPSPVYMAMLQAGNIIRRLRVIRDDERGFPIFDGDGELLPPLSEADAIAHIAWKDVPYDVQQAHLNGNRKRIALYLFDLLPSTREERDSWRWDGEGKILVPAAA